MAENKVNTSSSLRAKPDGWTEETGAAKPEAAADALDPKALSADGILTNEEVAAIREEAKKRIAAERKKNAKDLLIEAETARLRHEEGFVTGISHRDEMVNFTIDVAEYAPGVTINGRPYWHGHTYTVPRHVAETLRDICLRTHQHQASIDGKDRRAFYQQHRETQLSPVKGVKGAPAAPGADVAA